MKQKKEVFSVFTDIILHIFSHFLFKLAAKLYDDEAHCRATEKRKGIIVCSSKG
jgi:hypothetical protein